MTTPPAVHPTTTEIYRAIGRAFTEGDAAGGYHLLRFLDPVGSQLGYVDDLVRDDGPVSGWGKSLDPDAARAEHLRWLGQFVGVRMAQALSEAEKRERVKNREGWDRGKVASLRRAAQLFLTGNKTVEIYERDGSPYRLRVRTFSIQTTDAARLSAELQKRKPGGLILTHEVVAGGSYNQLSAAFATYNALDTAFADYNAQTNWVPA